MNKAKTYEQIKADARSGGYKKSFDFRKEMSDSYCLATEIIKKTLLGRGW